MTCNDKDGKPNLEEARQRANYRNPGNSFNNNSSGQGSRYRAGQDMDEIAELGNPYMSEEEMAAFTKEYLR